MAGSCVVDSTPGSRSPVYDDTESVTSADAGLPFQEALVQPLRYFLLCLLVGKGG